MKNKLDKWAGIRERATRYKRTCIYFGDLHYKSAEAAFRRHQLLGIPVVVIGTLVTTSIFATLNTSPAIGWKIAAGVISLIGAVLSALQIFLRFSEKASEHKASAANYRALGRRVDIFLLKHEGISRADVDELAFESALEQLEKIADALSELAGSSPHVTRTQNPESDLERSERIP
jgi:hypothetical protein